MVYPKKDGTMSDCIIQEIGTVLPDAGHVRGVRDEYKDIDPDLILHRFTVIKPNVHNQDRTNLLPRRLIVHTSQGAEVSRGRSGAI